MQLRAGCGPRGNFSRWSLAASVLLAAVLFYWSVRGVEWRHVWEAILRARAGWLWCAAWITTFSFVVRAFRWRILLNAEARLGIGAVFQANMVGYLGNNFLPARAGELLRSLLISRASSLSNTYVLTTALSERLMDVVAVILAAALALLALRSKPAWMTDLSRGMAFAALAGAVAIAVLPRTGSLIDALIPRLPLPERIRKFLLSTADQVLLGVRAFHDWGRLAGFAALTALIWSADGLGIIVGARSLGLAIPIPIAMLLLAAMALGSALPSTPGYLGIYQFAAVMVLGPAGIPRDEALAYSFLGQAVSYVVVAALGLPSLYGLQRGLKETG